MTVFGVLVAAGRGERFGAPKHHLPIAGVPMWERSRQALLDGGVGDVVVVGDLPGAVPGGERRRDSVLAGLQALPAGAEWVLVHDAARPLASPRLVARVIERLLVGDVDGVVPAIPLRDTVKRTDGEAVVGTIERSVLVSAQTPQGFRLAVLRRAHAADTTDATDDAALVERSGGSVVTVVGEAGNIKITYPEDLRMAEGLVR